MKHKVGSVMTISRSSPPGAPTAHQPSWGGTDHGSLHPIIGRRILVPLFRGLWKVCLNEAYTHFVCRQLIFLSDQVPRGHEAHGIRNRHRYSSHLHGSLSMPRTVHGAGNLPSVSSGAAKPSGLTLSMLVNVQAPQLQIPFGFPTATLTEVLADT